jgi:hypothetical protein
VEVRRDLMESRAYKTVLLRAKLKLWNSNSQTFHRLLVVVTLHISNVIQKVSSFHNTSYFLHLQLP